MTKLAISTAIVGFSLAGVVAVVQSGGQEAPGESQPPAEVTLEVDGQPIQFPHNTHATTYQIECMYCHFSAERSVDAGIPPVATCAGCHTYVRGSTETAQAEIAKVMDYFGRGESIPWKRIYKVSDHVNFPHMRHINAGMQCQECHGEVQNMGVLTERDPAWGGNNMGWCVSCHIERDVSRDCTVCHY